MPQQDRSYYQGRSPQQRDPGPFIGKNDWLYGVEDASSCVWVVRIRSRPINMRSLLSDFSVTKIADDLEDLAPGGKRAFVLSLVFIDCQDEFKEFVRHFPFFRFSSQVATASARTAASFQAATSVY